MAMEMKSPLLKTSAKRVTYRRSDWSVQEFEVWRGGSVCRAAALSMHGSLLVWVGAGSGAAPRLAEVALGVPRPDGAALATALLSAADGDTAPLAARLARALARPVYVCCDASFDRFTLPLVECALLARLKNIP